ncbi:hypothetical protein C1Y08_00630 [Pseudomonas sp. FW306-02-F02-AA]|uniref:Uncharacterized protein n=1 Tax=Pseudomonas fluorescens TaxID=294 RepID=A0A0N9WL12_PSEFL|nr:MULTISPECIES: hypothetical protein [Pseudomonas]ALI04010.1 hypothetical protein AO353_24150 [Pseudomonas fluorescens]PMZ04933.1 hypothetical protein C1Y07_07495 [Pseudomonas sp. FW306-02-F02-AB]PMZ12098.1 hypothetical protein C1Y06_01435 [Pseudomonas sp. FW306-02-H06C]PMZ17858.1 hypothetical protein C1Y08_00630 [Pseudomonas sp. FW306-02-F02-AA]PMZ23890.1 hypothetical protein C1Y09_00630 [Pseudomonas sp. FW306-02-F08-AA]
MAMTEEEAQAIGEFYAAVDRLKSLKIVRSDKYLGDIAEFLAKSELGMTIAESQRQEGYDGHIGERKLQVKYSGGTSNTVDAGDPSAYDDLVIILGPQSVLRPDKLSDPYVYYRIPSEVVKMKAAHADKKIRFSVRQIPQSYRVVSGRE